MKGITFLSRKARRFVRWPEALSTEFDLGPNETWLLVKFHGHRDGVYTPSVQEIHDAARAEGACQVPNIKTLEKAYKSLQEKGYIQARKVNTRGYGAVWVRSVTGEPWDFPEGHDLFGPGAPTDEELTAEIVKFNASQQRPDIVRAAYERAARRERAAAGNVVALDEFRRRHAG